MKINIPSEEEFQKTRMRKRIQAVFGFIFGVLFFGILSIDSFRYGFDKIAPLTWIALGAGVISFTLLAYKFGDEFWHTLFKN